MTEFHYGASEPQLSFSPPFSPYIIRIQPVGQEKYLNIIYKDGRLICEGDLPIDEAARTFFDALMDMIPNKTNGDSA